MPCPDCPNLTIGNCAPYANRDDVLSLVQNICADCVGTVPYGTLPVDFCNVAFGGVQDPCCDVLTVLEIDPGNPANNNVWFSHNCVDWYNSDAASQAEVRRFGSSYLLHALVAGNPITPSNNPADYTVRNCLWMSNFFPVGASINGTDKYDPTGIVVPSAISSANFGVAVPGAYVFDVYTEYAGQYVIGGCPGVAYASSGDIELWDRTNNILIESYVLSGYNAQNIKVATRQEFTFQANLLVGIEYAFRMCSDAQTCQDGAGGYDHRAYGVMGFDAMFIG